MKTTPTAARSVLVLLLALALFGLPACADDDQIELEAIFDDVIDLVPRHHVRAGDVPIGHVTEIELTDDDRALVRMRVHAESGLPADVEAVLRMTTLLGERFVELRPLDDGGALEAGRIERTRVLSDVEDLVLTGGELVAAISADHLARSLEVGAVAFGGRGGTLGTALDRLETFVGRYDEGSDDIVRLIDASDQLFTTMASEADAHGDAIAELARASRALAEEDERLLDAVDDLARLSDVGERILSSNRDEFDDAIRRLRLVIDELLRVDNALQNVLTWLPRHNLHVPNGVLNEMAQVWNDFSMCGVDSEEDNPANTCDPENPGESSPPPPTYAGPDDCDFFHEGCPYPEGAEPYQPEGYQP